MIKVQIDRKKWLRGDNGRLRDEEGSQCCLGFVCKKLGLTNNDIYDCGTPSDVIEHGERLPESRKLTIGERLSPLIKKDKVKDYADRAWVNEAIKINDDFNLPYTWYAKHRGADNIEEYEATERMREEKLTKLFAKHGFELKFIG